MLPKPHYLSSQSKKLLNGQKILLTSKINRFNELDEQFAMNIHITEQELIFASDKKTERNISIEEVESITLSKTSTEMIIHFFQDPDERFNSSENQLQIAEMIVYLKTSYFSDNSNHKFPIYFVDEINLDMFVTTEDDLEDGHTIRPEDDDMKMLTYYQFRQMYEKKQETILRERRSTRTLYSQTNDKVTKDDFELLKVLGKGSHGKVLLCCRKGQPDKLFAMKILKKQHIIEAKQIEHTKAEKLILQHVNHPFLVSLKHSFQTGPKIYFVLEFMKGGELFQHLRRIKRFSEEQTKFIAACLVLGIGHLHNKDYIYRDLKPENVLLDEKGYAKLTDFGLAKFLKVQEVATTFCGTPEYLSPEVILDKGCNRPADWWALGTLIYEMIYGIPPFYSRNVQKMYKNIILKQLKFKDVVQISQEGKDFISGLLIKNPAKRLGSIADSLEVINHDWFKNFDWTKLIEKQLKSPYNPIENENEWIKNFDPSFTKQQANDSICFIDPKFIDQFKKDFEDFDFDFEPSIDHKQTDESENEQNQNDQDSPIRSYSTKKQEKNQNYFKRLKSTPKKNLINQNQLTTNLQSNQKKVLKFQY